jgi:cytochrome c biogenesis factor
LHSSVNPRFFELPTPAFRSAFYVVIFAALILWKWFMFSDFLVSNHFQNAIEFREEEQLEELVLDLKI